jgi:hypothetical protein
MQFRKTLGCAVVALTAAPAIFGAVPACPEEPFRYNGFTVDQVQVTSPLSFVPAVSGWLSGLKPGLPVQPKDSFDAGKYSAGVTTLKDSVTATLGDTARLRVIVVTGSLGNCQEHSLDITYHVFFLNFPAAAAPTIEQRRDETQRPSSSAAEKNAPASIVTTPLAGFNPSRHLFGGFHASLATRSKLFDSFDISEVGSPSGTETQASLVGSRSPRLTLLDSADYRIQYWRSDLPSPLTHLRQAFIEGRFLATSKPLFAGNIRARWGVGFQGGHEDTSLAPVTGSQTLAAAGGGSLKLAFGATGRFGEHSVAASYGLALGASDAAFRLDYARQVLDAGWNGVLHWPFKDAVSRGHWPIAIQARVGAGQINVRNRVPASERFFGGNSVASFFPGAAWDIRSGPFIRGISENRLAATGFGGDRYASISLTIAPTVFPIPLIPWKVLRDPQFQTALQTGINTGMTATKLFYIGRQPAAKELAQKLDVIFPNLDHAESVLESLRDQLPSALQPDLDEAERRQAQARQTITNARKDPTVLPAVRGSLRMFANGLNAFNTKIADVSGADQQRKELGDLATALLAQADQVEKDRKAIDVTAAQKQAERDFAEVRPIINTFVNELNGIAISPVFLFDAARIHPDPTGFHCAPGAGIRFTALIMNLTLGWAHNAHPLPQFRQTSNTFFVSFDITDLFR